MRQLKANPLEGGFPAWAGIDHRVVGLGGLISGLPRVGGDRPGWLAAEAAQDAASPRGRG